MTLAWPAALLLLAPLLVLAGWLELRRGAGRAVRLALRLALLGALGLASAQPSLAWQERAASRSVAAVDRSAALDAPARAQAAEALAAFLERARGRGAAASVLGFGALAAAPVRDVAGGGLGAWPTGSGPVPEPAPAEHARASAGLLAARACFSVGEAGSILLLLGPGADLAGLEELARDLAAAGVTLEAEVVPHTDERTAPPQVRGLDAPEESAGPFDVRASLTGPPGLAVRLWVDGSPAATRAVPDDGPRRVVFEGLDLPPGRHLVALEPLARDAPARATAPAALALREVEVRETPRLVLCVADPERSTLRRAAQAQGLLVEAVAASDLGARLAPEAAAFHVLVLDGASAAALDAPTAHLVERRIAAGQGLFLEAGGDPRAWAALAGSPLSALLPVEPLAEPPPPPPSPAEPAAPPPEPEPPPTPPEPAPGPGRKAERQPEEALPISLLLVLDRSGSMHGPRWAMASEAALRATGVLSPFDRVGVVTFAEDARVDLAMGPAATPAQVALRLPPEADGRGTNIVAALRKATEVMAQETFPIRHVLLLTDGYHNPTGQRTEAAIWADIVRPLSALGVTLTVVGLSEDHDERTLKEIVQWAHRGLYIPAYAPSQVPTVFVVDAQRVTEARSREARARLPDPERGPAPRRPDAPPQKPPLAPPPARPPRPSEPPEALLSPALAPLTLGQPHAATRGFEAPTLPSVEPPRRSGPRLGAPVLLERSGQPFLAARRHGLGRVLAFLARPGDPGLAAWEPLGRLYGQALRSLVAPVSTFEGLPGLEIVPGPRGDALTWAGDGADVAAGRRLWWRGAGAERDLGPAEAATGSDPLDLPELPRGAVGHAELREASGVVLRAITYVAGTASAPPTAAETAARLAALDLRGAPAGAGLRERWLPLSAWLVALALLLLPLDAWLHRRR